MKNARCIFYDAPSRGFPALAVVLDLEGEVLAARSVSVGAAECAFAEMISNMAVTDDYVFILDGQYESADFSFGNSSRHH